MVEDEGNKQEEKFEFTAEGEALDYISLAQARMLAMQTARETPGDYGRRFSSVPMAFEVIESSADEVYYNATLSFRPQGQFTGALGQEQFFIEKEGSIFHRQVLAVPRQRRPLVIPVAIRRKHRAKSPEAPRFDASQHQPHNWREDRNDSSD